jgi:hypothetical protein
MAQLLSVSREEMVAEVEREIRLRRRVYPNFVRTRKLSQQRADRQIEIMEAIVRLLLERQEAT